MSAFLCSTTHTLAVALAVHRIDGTPAQPTARTLRALNNAALHGRYGRESTTRLYCSSHAVDLALRWLETATPAEVYSLALCLKYQCSEFHEPEARPEWPVLMHCLNLLSTASGGISSTNVWSI